MADGNRRLDLQPFQVDCSDHIATGEAWRDWLDDFERQLRYFRITEDDDKTDALLIYGGPEVKRLSRSLEDPEKETKYEKLSSKLSDYFSPKKNTHYCRYLFFKMRPKSGESTVEYAARLRDKALPCKFVDIDDRILEHIVQTTSNSEFVKKVLYKKWTLQEALSDAQIHEDTSVQIDAMGHQDRDIARISKKKKPFTATGDSRNDRGVNCKYCNRRHPFQKEKCPAYGKKCDACGKFNHFAKVCRSKYQENRGRPRPNRGARDVRHTSNDTDSEQDSDADNESLEDTLKHLSVSKIQVSKITDLGKTIPVAINDVILQIEPDSGADANVMDENQFRNLKRKSNIDIVLENCNTKLSTLQSKLPVLGEFKATVSNRTRGLETKFIVIKGKINSHPLLSKASLYDLGMLEIRVDGSLKDPNDLRYKDDHEYRPIFSVQQMTEIDEILKKHVAVFSGIGKIEDKKNKEDFLVKFSMKPDAAPIAQKPRPVPYYLQEPLKQWLDMCIEEEIFEKVEPGDPVTWCSPLVVQPKPRYLGIDQGKLEPHMIRASVDLRVPNKFMERNRILQAPVVEDFTYKFHECNVFSKMDLKQGYHQLMLHPDSRSIATFSTPWGNMRPKRLIFGAKSSQDLFDEAMYRIFGDIPYCLNQRYDILIGGVNIEEHNKTLQTVLQRAEDFGITFNKQKCQFGVKDLEFYGYRFTSNGLKPTYDKVKAVKECKAPESREEVRSFLGMIGYLSKFIPRYAILTAPLRRLTGKEIPFSWGPEEERAFKILKDSITNDDTMAFFNPRKQIIVRTEATFHEGLSAGLFQNTIKGLQPVHYISRSMTQAEKRYSQTEKDALAVKWAKTRFSIYLLGAPKFKTITSHKQLITMFNKACAKLPPRIEKWIMEMQDVDFELIYQPGKDEADPMDYLSRHPLNETDDDDTDHTIKIIVENEHGPMLERVKVATAKDTVLQDVLDRMKRNDWEMHKKRPEILPYYLVRHDLYRSKGMILRNRQIVIPEKLHKTIIKAAHSMGHFGITRTKQMLRAKYWFPNLNSLVENTISRCYHCQIATVEPRQEPVKPSEIPETEWHTVSVDFGGPYPDGHYNFVLVDKRTRYPVVEQTRSTSSKTTCEKLRGIFATYGVPERLESENGPPFNSIEFKEFSKEMGFHHHRVTPEHPRTNGEAERFMKVLNKTEKIARTEKKSSYSAIQQMLMGYRSTPHPATGYSPYEAMMKRNVRTLLDRLPNNRTCIDTMEKEITIQDREYKKKWEKQQRHPIVKKHKFKLGDKVLVRNQIINKWSSAFEKEPNVIIEINGSSITVRRHSDGRIRVRDASKYKLFLEPRNDEWRERLLRAPVQKQRGPEMRQMNPNQMQNRDTDNIDNDNEINTQHSLANRRESKRKRRFPSWKFKDYILPSKRK